jgi:hypothetical protein
MNLPTLSMPCVRNGSMLANTMLANTLRVVLDKYYPDAEELLREPGVESLARIQEYYLMAHVQSMFSALSPSTTLSTS